MSLHQSRIVLRCRVLWWKGCKKLSYKLKIAHHNFISNEELSDFRCLFINDSFNKLRVLTYSFNFDVLDDISKYFQSIEVIIGSETTVKKSHKEFLKKEYNMSTLNNSTKDLVLNKRILIKVADRKQTHQKIFLLTGDNEESRVIVGSANFTRSALTGGLVENFIVLNNDEKGYAFYNEEYERIRKSTKAIEDIDISETTIYQQVNKEKKEEKIRQDYENKFIYTYDKDSSKVKKANINLIFKETKDRISERELLFMTISSNTKFFITNAETVYAVSNYGRIYKPSEIVKNQIWEDCNYLMDENEYITCLFNIRNEADHIVFISKKSIAYKKSINSIIPRTSRGKQIINLENEDEIVFADSVRNFDRMFLSTYNGKYLFFNVSELKIHKIDYKSRRLIWLDDDYISDGTVCLSEEGYFQQIGVVLSNGYMKIIGVGPTVGITAYRAGHKLTNYGNISHIFRIEHDRKYLIINSNGNYVYSNFGKENFKRSTTGKGLMLFKQNNRNFKVIHSSSL